jgi:hypothetical protein
MVHGRKLKLARVQYKKSRRKSSFLVHFLKFFERLYQEVEVSYTEPLKKVKEVFGPIVHDGTWTEAKISTCTIQEVKKKKQLFCPFAFYRSQ